MNLNFIPISRTIRNPWRLNDRQLKTLELLSQGVARKNIPEMLGFTLKSLENDTCDYLKKMKVKNSLQAVLVYDRYFRSCEKCGFNHSRLMEKFHDHDQNENLTVSAHKQNV